MSDLDRAVETVIGRCLGVRAGEQVAVVVDEHTRALGDAPARRRGGRRRRGRDRA